MKEKTEISFIKPEYLIGILILCILPFLILNYFNHPAPEDFHWAEQTKRIGFTKTIRSLYKFVGGRYFTYSLVSLSPLVFNSMTGYRICSLFLMLLFFYVIFLFVNEITKNSLTIKERFLFSLSIIFLYLYGMDSIREGFYWTFGAIQYHVSLVLIMLFSIFYIRLDNDNNFNKRILYTLITCLIVIIIPGTNELAASLILILVISLIIKNFLSWKKNDQVLILFVVLIGIGLYFAISSPGNFVRFGWSSENRSVFYLSNKSFSFLLESFWIWIFKTPLLIITLLLVPIFLKLIKKTGSNENLFSINPVFSFLFFFVLIFTNIYMIMFSQGVFPYDRTLNFIFFVFLIGWFCNVIVLSNYLNKKFEINFIKLPKYIYPIAFVLLIFFLSRDNNIKNAYSDLIEGTAQKYHNELNERYEYILKSNSDSIEVDHVTVVPKSFYSLETVDDSNKWFMRSYSSYFNKKSIVVKKYRDKLE